MWSWIRSCGTICVVVRVVSESAGFRRVLASSSARSLIALSACVFALGCGGKAQRKQRAPLPELAASSWLIDLDVPGFGAAKLAVPIGATEPRPIVIALHGAADRPEWACGAWRGIAGPRPFVLCPRGTARADFAASDARFTFGDAAAVSLELRAGLAALKNKFGAHVAPGSVVFAGFDLGADRVAEIAQQEPTFFSRLALVAAGSEAWPTPAAALFGRRGGERVLFAAGPATRAGAVQKAVLTRRGDAEAKAIFLGDHQPALDGAGIALLKQSWAWLNMPVKRLAPVEDLVGNPLQARRPPKPDKP